MTARLGAAAAVLCSMQLGACADAGVPAVGEARLIKDLGPGSSDPGGFFEVGRVARFVTADGTRWRTDGTPSGTMPLSESVAPAGATLFYASFDAEHGSELWKTDGTSAGTVLVKDIQPGTSGSPPGEFVSVSGLVFFVACDGVHGWELWTTDGTASGTVMVADIDRRPPPGGDNCTTLGWRLRDLRERNGRLYFLADDGGAGLGLWQSDGTAAGTSLVYGVPREGPNSPRDTRPPVQHLTKAAGRLFFTTRSHLWTSDGTAAGTIALPPVSNSVVAGTPSLFFYLSEGGVGRSDGTAAGTYDVVNVHVPTDIRFASRLTQVATVGDRLFFLARAEGELWTSDGTPEGTGPVEGPEGAGSGPFSLTPLDGNLYYAADHVQLGRQLWRADGSGRARRLTDVSGEVAPGRDNRLELPLGTVGLGTVGSTIVFPANDGDHGTELWGYRAR